MLSSSLLLCPSCSIIKIMPENNTIGIVLLSYILNILLLETPSNVPYIHIHSNPYKIHNIFTTRSDAPVISQPSSQFLHQNDGEEQTGSTLIPQSIAILGVWVQVGGEDNPTERKGGIWLQIV